MTYNDTKTVGGQPNSPHPGTVEYDPRGWVVSFLYRHPSDEEALSANGVCDENSFLAREAGLERPVRHRIGVFRARYFVGKKCKDPCKLAGAAPPWLADQSIGLMNLPGRAYNALRNSGIYTVRDIASWSSADLLKLRNFGQKSLRDILQALMAALDAGPVRASDSEAYYGSQGRRNRPAASATGADRMEAPPPDAAALKPRGWVLWFLNENPSDAEMLSAHGVFDEATFLAREAGLERDVRHRVGVFRTHHVAGKNCEDPCRLAGAAPPWLSERRLSTLGQKPQTNNALWRAGCITVRDLAKWSSVDLMRVPNYGRKSLGETLQSLTAALNAGPIPTATSDTTPGSNGLLSEIQSASSSLSDRERDILDRSLGFDTTQQTFQEIGARYDISVERARQIWAIAIRKLRRDSSWYEKLEQKITLLLADRSTPLPVSGLEAADEWFEGVSACPLFFRNLVKTVGKGRIHIVRIGGVDYLSFMTRETWKQAVSGSAELLTYGAERQWSEHHACLRVRELLPTVGKEFRSLLWDISSEPCHFKARADGSHVLTGYGRGTDQAVEAILAESPTPLHHTEIGERLRIKENLSLDSKQIRAAAASVGHLFAPGTYGLMHHLRLSDEHIADLRFEAEEIICWEIPGKKWRTSDILSEVSKRLGDGYDGLNKYVLEIALSESSRLVSLGKRKWISATADTDRRPESDVHQAVVAILKRAGTPLKTGEIKERLSAVRQIDELRPISLIDPLVRVKPGVWGINDRDVPLSRFEQRGLVSVLVHALGMLGRGIHTSELSRMLPLGDCPTDAFLSVAVHDARLKIGQGSHVFLSEWEGSRRETIGDATAAVLNQADGPLSLKKIAEMVEGRVGRKINKRIIPGMLRYLKADFDAVKRVWSLNRSRPEDDHEDDAIDAGSEKA